MGQIAIDTSGEKICDQIEYFTKDAISVSDGFRSGVWGGSAVLTALQQACGSTSKKHLRGADPRLAAGW